jgi:Endoribonuclease L-PSP
VIADEIAYWPIDESSAEPDSEIINALRPGMATIPGALLLAASSPYARRGELRRQHRATLAQADAKLSDLVTMTVFLTDARNHPRMTAIRREILGKDFPASASISISHLANPNALIEIQAVAVIA